MSKIKYLFLLLVCSVCLADSVAAWDNMEHKIIAYIAWKRMAPRTQEQVSRILLAAPEDSDISAFYPVDSRSAAEKEIALFMAASTWADIVRDRKFTVRFEKYNQDGWHRASSLWKMNDGQLKVLAEPETKDGNAVTKLIEFDKLLRDTSVADKDKSVALAWVLHLIGDIHQPLHTSERVTKREPGGDRGANLFMLSPPDAPRENTLNLHSFWDGIVSRYSRQLDDVTDPTYLPHIVRGITRRYSLRAMENRLKPGQFDEWRDESFKLAMTRLFPNSLKRGRIPSKKYNEIALEISEERIALAGYRMSAMLNQIFGR